MQTENNQLAVIEKSIDVFRTGPAILKANQERSAKALIVGRSIVQQWDLAWAITDTQERLAALAAADERSNKYLANCSVALKEEKELRAVITQLMTEFSRMFTAAENEIDKTKPHTVPYEVQNNRDTYAKQLAEEEKRRAREAEEAAAKARARIEQKTKISTAIATCLNSFLARKKEAWNKAFTEITLENIEEISTNLANLNCSFPETKLSEIVTYTISPVYPFSPEELKKIDGEAFQEFGFMSFYDQYSADLEELKRNLIDRLPSKKLELESIAKAAEEDRIRQEEIARAEGARKKQLEEEAKAAEVLRQQQAEAIRKRESEDAERLRIEAEEKQKQSQMELDLKSQADQTMVMFEKEASIAEVSTPKPESRTGYEIIVQHPVGYTQIFQFYFEREGKTLALPDLGRKTLDQMKSFCEKTALKTGEKIESKFLQYKDVYKAVNRKIPA